VRRLPAPLPGSLFPFAYLLHAHHSVLSMSSVTLYIPRAPPLTRERVFSRICGPLKIAPLSASRSVPPKRWLQDPPSPSHPPSPRRLRLASLEPLAFSLGPLGPGICPRREGHTVCSLSPFLSFTCLYKSPIVPTPQALALSTPRQLPTTASRPPWPKSRSLALSLAACQSVDCIYSCQDYTSSSNLCRIRFIQLFNYTQREAPPTIAAAPPSTPPLLDGPGLR